MIIEKCQDHERPWHFCLFLVTTVLVKLLLPIDCRQEHLIRIDKPDVIQACDTVTVRTKHRWDRWVDAITLVWEACPISLVHRMEQIRTVHEGE